MYLILTQCFPPAVGGIENLIHSLAKSLVAEGVTVSVFADGPAQADNVDTPYHIRWFNGIKFLRRRRKAREAEAFMRCNPVRHVFCDSWKSLEHVCRPNNEVCITVFAHGSEYPRSPTLEKLKRINTTLAKADRILAVSKATHRRMQNCGVEADNMSVWYPPIDALTTDDNTRSWAEKIWQGGKPRMLTVARLIKRKNIDTVILAMLSLIEQYPEIRYVIVGDGDENNMLRKLLEKNNLKKYVKLIGIIDSVQKTALYESADLFVLASREVKDDMEGFGLVFLEAALSGLPAVSGNRGGVLEVVEDGVTGLHSDGKDVDSVKNAIKCLLSDNKLRNTLGGNARKKALASLWEARTRELL